ncbi:protein kinase (macronuclear) [Tetrahymena thermophila SB210]|uniref:Protein kinase n=1 Tax=Tetrahymena thermophila (strain SB210) TaxID=312017 RepID=I7MMB2_TETTS|nr:protein kinase [Tetrahymena thermophila SB210]EAS04515.1 protein kinase [Tetrahymena thermophila SB210]|eukprot:XP_001024760.1 protein kinase [Tetrahymena thermophila SB210]
MGAKESIVSPRNLGEKTVDEDQIEVLNSSSMDLIEKTADFLKVAENENYGRFKLMQYRVSKRQFALIERITSDFKEFENYCNEVDKRLKFDCQQLVRWIRAYRSCEKEYCSSFFKVFVNLDYIPFTLHDQLESRKKRKTHCGEKEIFTMIDSVLTGLIYLKSHNLNHKFIQPKTILYDQANRVYLISDIQFLNGGISEYQQYLFGVPATSCYLSPQLLKALNHRQQIPEHSISKSDVFSLGLCALEMATMKSIQNIYDFNDFKIYEDLLQQLLQEVQVIYSDHLSQLLIQMLSLTEVQRPDFDDLAYVLKDLSARPQFIDSRQSLRASVISEELQRTSSGTNRKSGLLERPVSCNLLRSKETNKSNNNQNSNNNNNSSLDQNKYMQKQFSSNNNNNNKTLSGIRPAQSILKKSGWKKEGGTIGEIEEEDNQLTAVNTQGGDTKDQQVPFIRVLEPILTHENDEVASPAAIPSHQQLGEISSLNLISQRNNIKQLSAYNQEDLQMQQQTTKRSTNNNIKTPKSALSANDQQANEIQNINLQQQSHQQQQQQLQQQQQNQYDLQQIQSLQQQQQKQQSQPQNRQQRSLSQISSLSQKPVLDTVEQEYEEFKAKQRQLYMQQKHQIIQDEQAKYQQEKQSWEQQHQQFIQESKKSVESQQIYLQSQFEDSRKYLNSQQQYPTQTREFTNYLQNQRFIQNSDAVTPFAADKSPVRNNYSRMGNNINTPNNYRVDSYSNPRLPPSSGRNNNIKSYHQLNKSPKLNLKFFNDENEYNIDNRLTGRSNLQNNYNENTMYNEYQSYNNLNNSRLDNSVVNSKADMSMLSNYELKDIHIQPLRRNDINIQNTLNMLEEKIDKIDQSLNYAKKPLRSSSNNSFAFHQNSKLLSNNNNNNQKGQQNLQYSKNNQQRNTGSSAKNYRFYNQNYESKGGYPTTPFQNAYNFDNTYHQHI